MSKEINTKVFCIFRDNIKIKSFSETSFIRHFSDCKYGSSISYVLNHNNQDELTAQKTLTKSQSELQLSKMIVDETFRTTATFLKEGRQICNLLVKLVHHTHNSEIKKDNLVTKQNCLPWSLTGVTRPLATQSKDSGKSSALSLESLTYLIKQNRGKKKHCYVREWTKTLQSSKILSSYFHKKGIDQF